MGEKKVWRQRSIKGFNIESKKTFNRTLTTNHDAINLETGDVGINVSIITSTKPDAIHIAQSDESSINQEASVMERLFQTVPFQVLLGCRETSNCFKEMGLSCWNSFSDNQ
jgi:hypothetical protein